MKQKNQRLINEINKLIKNILAKHGEVYLPQVGSFKVEEQKVGADGKNRVQSLSFTTKESERSIIKTISKRGNCTEKQAEQVYMKWFEEVNEDGVIIIEGIGVVRGEVFTANEVIAQRLNPTVKESVPATQERIEPIQIKESDESKAVIIAPTKEPKERATTPKKAAPSKPKKSSHNWRTAICIGAAIITALVAIMVATRSKESDSDTAKKSAISTVEVSVDEAIKSTNEGVERVERVKPKASKVNNKVAEGVKVEGKKDTPKAKSPKATERSTSVGNKNKLLTKKARYASSGEAIAAFERVSRESDSAERYRVVCGVLNSRVNVGRLLMDIDNLSSKYPFTPRIYPRNGSYMVTLFESKSLDKCLDFINNYKSKSYDTMWLYDAQTM